MRRSVWGLRTVSDFVNSLLFVAALFVASIQFLILPFTKFLGSDYFAASIRFQLCHLLLFAAGSTLKPCTQTLILPCGNSFVASVQYLILSFTSFRGGDCFVASMQSLFFLFTAFGGDD